MLWAIPRVTRGRQTEPRPSRISDAEADPSTASRPQPPITSERPERKEGAVAVVAQIKDAREADGGVPGLVPISVLVLGIHQEIDAADNRRMFDLSGRHQPEQGPSCLRWRAVKRITMLRLGPVRFPALAPASVAVLSSCEPIHGPPHLSRKSVV